MTLDEVIAHTEIRQVLASYCRGVDRRDAELLRSIYHPDATDDHTMFVGPGVEFADFIVGSLDGVETTGQHQITTSYIEVDGDVARVESYYLSFHPLAVAGEDREKLLWTGGRYLDRFEKRDGRWKIADRVVTVDWGRDELPGAPWPGMSDYPPTGPKGSGDPSDALFGAGTASSARATRGRGACG